MPRGLGRGLESLIPTDIIEEKYDPTATADSVVQVDPEKIDPNPHQPRTTFDQKELDALADSIKLHGILQPTVLTPAGERYQLIAGERRVRAAKQIGLKKVPAIIRSFDEQQKLELALIENLQRAELNPIETATAYRKLAEQFNLSLAEIARRIGRGRPTISNALRLLALPDEAKEAIAKGEITEGHARVLLTIANKPKQLEMIDLIIKHRWNVRQAEEFARGVRTSKGDTEKGLARIAGFSGDDEISRDLSKLLKHTVQIRPTAQGGRLIIHFETEEELARLAEALKQGWGN